MSKVNAAKELWAIDLELQKLRMKILNLMEKLK